MATPLPPHWILGICAHTGVPIAVTPRAKYWKRSHNKNVSGWNMCKFLTRSKIQRREMWWLEEEEPERELRSPKHRRVRHTAGT